MVNRSLHNTSAAQGGTADCEFCREFADVRESRFGQIYGGTPHSRVISTGAHFAIMPTLGQLFTGSMLIVPFAHIEAAARLSSPLKKELVSTVAELIVRLQPLGNSVVFEHGAVCSSGAGCGIYHAHVHVVPVPESISCEDILPGALKLAADFGGALECLREADSYIAVRDTAGITAFCDLTEMPYRYPSQYIRRRLAEHYHLKDSWDWRTYTHPESRLVESVRLFQL